MRLVPARVGELGAVASIAAIATFAVLYVAPALAQHVFAVVCLLELAVVTVLLIVESLWALSGSTGAASVAAAIAVVVTGAALVYAATVAAPACALAQVFAFGLAAILLTFAGALEWRPRPASVDAPRDPFSFEAEFAARALHWGLIAASVALVLAIIHPLFGVALGACALAYVASWIPPTRRTEGYELSRVIGASPEDLFAVVGDPEKAAGLLSMVESCVPLQPDLPRAGARFRSRIVVNGVLSEHDDELLEYESPHRLVARTVGPMANRLTLTLQPVDGGTRLTVSYWSRLTLRHALLRGVRSDRIRNRLVAMREEWIASVKEAVEAAPG